MKKFHAKNVLFCKIIIELVDSTYVGKSTRTTALTETIWYFAHTM